MCHGYEKILQTLNKNVVLLHVCHYAFKLAKKFLAEGRDVFPVNLVHLHVLQYFFAVAKEFFAGFDGNVLLDEVDNQIRLNCCLKKKWFQSVNGSNIYTLLQ